MFRLHLGTFVVVNLALHAANWLAGGDWWAFWPLAAWGLVLGVHYLIDKSRRVDQRWVQERADDLRSKSYDASHMRSIAERYKVNGTEPPAKP